MLAAPRPHPALLPGCLHPRHRGARIAAGPAPWRAALVRLRAHWPGVRRPWWPGLQLTPLPLQACQMWRHVLLILLPHPLLLLLLLLQGQWPVGQQGLQLPLPAPLLAAGTHKPQQVSGMQLPLSLSQLLLHRHRPPWARGQHPHHGELACNGGRKAAVCRERSVVPCEAAPGVVLDRLTTTMRSSWRYTKLRKPLEWPHESLTPRGARQPE